MSIDVQTCNDILPPFQLVKGIDLGYNGDYLFDVTANSQYAITSASDNLVRLYDLATLQLSHTIPAHSKKISKMKLKNDQFLFTASEDATLKRWDLRQSGANGPSQTVKCICIKKKKVFLAVSNTLLFIDSKPLTAFDINCNDTMAIVGTEFSSSTFSADLGFYDIRNTKLMHTFTDSHGDDITEVNI